MRPSRDHLRLIPPGFSLVARVIANNLLKGNEFFFKYRFYFVLNASYM